MLNRTKSHSVTDVGEYLILLFLFIASLGISLLVSHFGLSVGFIIIGLLVGTAALIWIFADYRVGFYLLIFYCHALFVLSWVFPLPIPPGTIVEGIMGLTLLSILIKVNTASNPIARRKDVPLLKNPIAYLIIISTAYDFMQLANPNSIGLVYSLMGFRESFYLLFVYIIAYYFFDRYERVTQFAYFWIGLSLLAALNALRQEYVGLLDFEWEFLTSDPRRWELYFIWGHIRKWSFLSDPSAFGLAMTFSSLFCFVVALRKFSMRTRLLAVASALIMMVAMSFSGTRTAYGVVPLGIMFYFLMTINSPRMIVAGIVCAFIALGLYFGPFYGPTMNRIRSTFNSEDASMSFRDVKRFRLQEHIMSHPVGSGLGRANAIAEQLTVTADTDNGFLRTAVDKGIPGLAIQFALYFAVMFVGIRGFYEARDEKIKSLYAAFLAGLFGMVIANFYQDVVDQKPLNVLIISVFAIILRMEHFPTKEIRQTD